MSPSAHDELNAARSTADASSDAVSDDAPGDRADDAALGDPALPVDAASASAPALVADEPLYAPGARRRASGAVAESNDEAAIARWNLGGSSVTAAPAVAETAKPPHPAPRVKVDLVSVRGRVDEADVLRQARAKGYWPLRLCYEAGLRRSQTLRGTTRVRFIIEKRGRVRLPKRVQTEIRDEQVVACLVQAIGALTLPAPVRGVPDVVLEVALYPGDEPVPARTAAPPRPVSELESVVRTLRETWPALRRCYAEGLARDPELWGRLAVRLRIATRGRVAEATEIESHFPDATVTGCVCRVLGQLDGIAAEDGAAVVYPLRFGHPRGDGGS